MMTSLVCIRKHIFFTLLFCLGMISAGFSQSVKFVTVTNSNSVALDEPFQVQFVLENATNIASFDPPEFKYFTVIQGPMQMQSSTIANGKATTQFIISYVLLPKQIGNFTIPAATARVNGDLIKSNPIGIGVSKARNLQRPQQQSNYPPPAARRNNRGEDDVMGGVLKKNENIDEKLRKNLFVKVDVDKTDVYEGEQITATYKLYTRLPTNSSVTKVPAFKGFSARDIELPNPPQAETEYVNGVPFKVFTIRKTMLFPLQNGTLELDPAEVDNQVRLIKEVPGGRNNRMKDIFDDPFFKDAMGGSMVDDPFFDDFFNRPNYTYEDIPYKIKSPVVKVHVKPLPADGKPASFTGAIGKFSMDVAPVKEDITTDDAITMKVTIKGQGNITLLNAPKLDLPPSFEVFDPKVSDNIDKNSNPLSGSKTFEYVIMPQESGKHTIPPVEFSYFDPGTQEYKTLQSPAIALDIAQGKKVRNTTPVVAGAAGNTFKNIIPGTQAWTLSIPYFLKSVWFWTLLLLPVLAIAFFYWKKQQQAYMIKNASLLKYKHANKVALKRLELAARYLNEGKDKLFYEETSRAVWGYLANKFHIPLAELNKQVIQDRLAAEQIDPAISNNLFVLLDNCEIALYAPSNSHDVRRTTYEQAITVISDMETALKKQAA
ncbi:hypothetical protein COR50_04620 [Chitinophaga caeni]|uniref:BatD protein n=1 Tax=Chitinophaga caeni TaxID=2029983 RepID=A0A291QRG7_9BACT|nr:BatD family protein [Chitinophaga caeni]ATL46515.1 hypothetical protein COR50_04620 [Chitinophaga caeni]